MSEAHGGVIGDGIPVCHLPPTMQADAVITQANPVSGTMYDWISGAAIANLAAATVRRNVRIISMSAAVTWTVQPNVEIHVLLDGIAHTWSMALPVTATYTHDLGFAPDQAPANQWLDTTAVAGIYRNFLTENKRVAIAFETTGGTTTWLNGRIKWATWP